MKLSLVYRFVNSPAYTKWLKAERSPSITPLSSPDIGRKIYACC